MGSALSYWCDRWLSIDVTGPEGSQSVRLSKPFARVGSHANSEVVLSQSGVGTRAAYLHATENAIWCFSFARSQEAPVKATAVKPGTGVHLGPYRLRVSFCEPERSSAERANRQLTTPSDSRFDLEFSAGDESLVIAQPLSETFAVIGRDPPSNILLADDCLSRVHCMLYRDRDQLWAIDLLSSNGTRLNGRRIDASEVLPVDQIKLGSHRLRYRVHGAQAIPQQGRPEVGGQTVIEQTVVREHREQIVTRVLLPGLDQGVPANWRDPVVPEVVPTTFVEPCRDAERIVANAAATAGLLNGLSDPPKIGRATGETPRIGYSPIHQAAPVIEGAAEGSDSRCVKATGRESATSVDCETATRANGNRSRSGHAREKELLDRLIDRTSPRSRRIGRFTIALAVTATVTAALSVLLWSIWGQ